MNPSVIAFKISSNGFLFSPSWLAIDVVAICGCALPEADGDDHDSTFAGLDVAMFVVTTPFCRGGLNGEIRIDPQSEHCKPGMMTRQL